MDMVVGLAKVLARPVAAMLGSSGTTPEQRRGEVMRDITSPAEDVADLGIRHLTRGATWGVLLAVVVPVGVIILTAISLTTGGVGDGVFVVAVTVMFFVFFLACVHFLKAIIAYYLPDSRWDRNKPVWRATMLWPVPDIAVAIAAAVLVAVSLA